MGRDEEEIRKGRDRDREGRGRKEERMILDK